MFPGVALTCQDLCVCEAERDAFLFLGFYEQEGVEKDKAVT